MLESSTLGNKHSAASCLKFGRAQNLYDAADLSGGLPRDFPGFDCIKILARRCLAENICFNCAGCAKSDSIALLCPLGSGF
jgi:hypothetical protein